VQTGNQDIVDGGAAAREVAVQLEERGCESWPGFLWFLWTCPLLVVVVGRKEVAVEARYLGPVFCTTNNGGVLSRRNEVDGATKRKRK